VKPFVVLAAAAALTGAAPAATVRVLPTAAPADTSHPLPMRTGGRTQTDGAMIERQWPDTYFDVGFRGTGVLFRVGEGEVHLHVVVDGQPPASLVRPKPGFYRIDGLAPGPHRVRVEVVSESQAGPTGFGGFFPIAGTTALPLPPATRRIEFIGDSHTVGYGNTSATRECTTDDVWATTDSSRGVGALTAAAFGAEYRVHAISGRGIVRNYDGFSADTIPSAYPFLLFDKAVADRSEDWSPQVVVIGIGTNDFSTALHPSEKWKTREDLRADFERSYARFVSGLRTRYPNAFFVLWATDIAAGEVEAEGRRVVERLNAAGERRVAFVPVHGLAMTACHGHPDLADDRAIAAALGTAITAHHAFPS